MNTQAQRDKRRRVPVTTLKAEPEEAAPQAKARIDASPAVAAAPLRGAGKGPLAVKKEEEGAGAGPVTMALQLGDVKPTLPPARLVEAKLPLEVGARVQCQWRDGKHHLVKVIERRRRPGAPVESNEFEYYVHYVGQNRRMDEWVLVGQMDLNTVELPEPVVEADTTALGRSNRQKQKKTTNVAEAAHDEESDEEHAEFDTAALREHEEFTKVKNIESIELGQHVMETWYFSPLPPDFKDVKKLYFCEFSLHFFKRRAQMLRHLHKVTVRHPPGDEIYRNMDDHVCMFEVDGKREKSYCQNLCYLAKLFLDHKTLFYDVDLFLFYILCEIDERGAHIVGYFSKEKCSEEGYNLACILMLPAYQRKGYGKFLISMSYELSKIENKVGTPERPLSDLGRVSYMGYWTRVLLQLLQVHQGTISIKELGDRTAVKSDDVLTVLQALGLLQTQRGQTVLCAVPKIIEKHLRQAGGPGLVVDPTRIVWTPYNAERDYKPV